MTSITFPTRIVSTSRPLGLLDLVQFLGRKLFARPASMRSTARADAAALRSYADGQRGWSPSFAADLYAAADRHELLNAQR